MRGWRKLYEPICRFIVANGGTIVQVKEKFGQLRLYWDPPEDMDGDMLTVIHHAVDSASADSRSICIECGKTAKLYTDGWIIPMCDEHAIAAGKDPTKAKPALLWTTMYELTEEEMNEPLVNYGR
jgi:hypothetical protein